MMNTGVVVLAFLSTAKCSLLDVGIDDALSQKERRQELLESIEEFDDIVSRKVIVEYVFLETYIKKDKFMLPKFMLNPTRICPSF